MGRTGSKTSAKTKVGKPDVGSPASGQPTATQKSDQSTASDRTRPYEDDKKDMSAAMSLRTKQPDEQQKMAPITPAKPSGGPRMDRSPARGRQLHFEDAGKSMSADMPPLASNVTGSAEGKTQIARDQLVHEAYLVTEDIYADPNDDWTVETGTICHWAVGLREKLWAEESGALEASRLVLRVDERKFGEEVRDTLILTGTQLVSDGERTFGVGPWDLAAWEPNEQDASRVLAHATATTSPRCEADQSAGLAWLSPEGLTRAHVSEFPVPRTAVPHLVGKGGRTVREAEDRLGVIIGRIDADNDQEAAVTLVGPREKVEVAQVVLGLLAKGVRSALSRFGGVG